MDPAHLVLVSESETKLVLNLEIAGFIGSGENTAGQRWRSEAGVLPVGAGPRRCPPSSTEAALKCTCWRNPVHAGWQSRAVCGVLCPVPPKQFTNNSVKLRGKSLGTGTGFPSPLATQHRYTPFGTYLNFNSVTKATLFLPKIWLIVRFLPSPQTEEVQSSTVRGPLGCASSSNSVTA